MGLLSIFKRKQAPASVASEPADAVQQARTRARQRLIGAAVLVVVGVVGFPLVFETQPRPIPIDIPIDVPRRDNAPALTMPAARAPTAAASIGASPRSAVDDTPARPVDTAGGRAPAVEPMAAASTLPVRPDPEAPPRAVVKADARPEPRAEARIEPKPASAPPGEGARALALLDGRPPSAAADTGRFVVQVGAFADAAAARDTRLRVERMGMKTYTQVATTSAGERIRVRVGPFLSREEADKAMARAKGAGLNAVVLAL